MIRRFFRTWLLAMACLLATTQHVSAAVSMIYQPLLAHMAIDESAWPTLFRQVHRSGIDTLVFQWTRHDDAFTTGTEAAWLEQRAQDALDAGLNLIIGLSADSDTFQRLEQPSTVLPAYFRKIREKDRALVSKWQQLIPKERLSGWYLPLEIDDKRWRLGANREALMDYLKHTSAEIARLDTQNRPIYISSFFTGQMSPQRYVDLTRQVHHLSGINVWIQDGAGVGTLTPAERSLYLSALMQCTTSRSPVAQGVIYELFKQVKTQKHAFIATPLNTTAETKALGMRAPCGLDTSYFGLNYLSPIFNLPTSNKP